MSDIPIRLVVEPLGEGGYLATSPDVPGLVAEGRTVRESMDIAQDLVRLIIECCIENGDPLPSALQDKPSGRLELTVPVQVL